MEKQPAILNVEHLQISFQGAELITIVQDLSFTIEKGKTLAIVGESGSGKSLTALALMGLLPASAIVKGKMEITLADRVYDLNQIHDSKIWQSLRGSEIGMVFQEPMSSLNPVMKIGKQLAETILSHQQVSEAEAKRIAIDWLTKVQLPNPERIYGRFPHQLSGGQKQRVMIAMSMCNKPALLIADEPTTALDVTVQKEVMTLMSQLQRENDTAMIFITHDLALAAETADNVLVLFRGEVMEYGTTDQVLHHPQNRYTKALVACKPSPEHKGQRLPIVADFMQDSHVEPESDRPQYATQVTDDVLLRVNNLRVWFSDETNWLGKTLNYFKAVDGVSFDLHRGEVLGLVGESGCGKSTVSRTLIGLLPVREGEIIFNGQDLATMPKSGWRKVRRDIQMIFQDPFASLNPRMTVGAMLMEPMQVHNIVPAKELRKEAQRLLNIVQLPSDALKRYPHQFSGGQRQRLGIARALALRPKLLICDESVSALDVSVQAQILNLLKELQSEFQLSYLFISHDLSVVHYISDRVMVMKAGKIVEAGDAVQILTNPHHEYTRKLIAAMPEMK